MTMPATLIELLGRQLIRDVRWGDLDYLIVDLPPGTADLQQQLFSTVDLAGAIVVVGTQAAAHLDARKLVAMLRDAAVPILGAVENMRGLACPHCGAQIDVFPPIAEERSILRDVAAEKNAAARAERLRAARAGTPYRGQAGHVPDTAITGRADPPAGWLDMPGVSNQVCGGVLGSRIGQTIRRFTVDGASPC